MGKQEESAWRERFVNEHLRQGLCPLCMTGHVVPYGEDWEEKLAKGERLAVRCERCGVILEGLFEKEK